MNYPWERMIEAIYRNGGTVERPTRSDNGEWKWDEVSLLEDLSDFSATELVKAIGIIKDSGLVEEGLFIRYESGWGTVFCGEEAKREVLNKVEEEDVEFEEKTDLFILTERGFDVAREQINQNNQIKLNRTISLLTFVLAFTAVIGAIDSMFELSLHVKYIFVFVLLIISLYAGLYFLTGFE